MYPSISEETNSLPNLSGSEELIHKVVEENASASVYRGESHIDFGKINSAFAIALHMHQPLIPAGGGSVRTAAIISNLKYMEDNQGIGDNYNAGAFRWCYKRMGEFIPQLISEGKEPRVMLEYSGTLLFGLRQMGANDVVDSLKNITMNSSFRRAVEWLRVSVGPCRCPVNAGAGFQVARKSVATIFRGDFRP